MAVAMLIDLNVLAATSDPIPDSWADLVTRTDGGLRITGDRTGDRETFIYDGAGPMLVASNLGRLLDHLRAEGLAIDLDPFAVSSLLHHGLVPMGFTEYRNIRFLAMGDSADVSWTDGRPRVELRFRYPWLVASSPQTGIPDTAKLLGLLTAATARRMADAGNQGYLMLSSGKDSTSVAIALAEAGLRDIPCVTYSSGPEDPEPAVAAATCRKLGLQHEILEMPTDTEVVATVMRAFFAASPRPGVDLSQIPYALATALSGGHGTVLDGGGNDSYMGFLPGSHGRTKLRFRVRGRRIAELIQRRIPVDSPLNYMTRSRAEATLPGRLLRLTETGRLYGSAVDTRRWWYEQSRFSRGLDLVDLFGAVKERHVDSAGSMQKLRLGANAVGMTAAMPFCDHDVADYYFSLPESARFDRRTNTNKLLLRQMLAERLGYDADAVGKHYFEFNGSAFIVRNRELIRSEIASCDLWNPGAMSMVDGWLRDIRTRPMLYHSVLTLFMVSGWYNHSRFLEGSRRA